MDEFTGDSGLKDDFDGTITEAEFVQTERGNWALQLTIECDDEDRQTPMYSVGGKDKGWTSLDGGETIEGPSKKARFHEKSTVQHMIQSAIDAGAGEELRRRSGELYEHRGPFHAALWLGLRFHWDVVEELQNRPDEKGEWHERSVQAQRTTKFLGVVGAGNNSGAAKAAANPAKAEANSANGATDISASDLKILTRLAAISDTYDDFVDVVTETNGSDGVPFLKNRVLIKTISQKTFYEELKG